METFNEKMGHVANLATLDSYKKEAVSVTIANGYDQKINIRIVQGTDVPLNPYDRKCAPRKGADRKDKKPLDLPPSVVANFPDINKLVMTWMNQAAGNAHLFLQDPVQSLLAAGVKLSREDQKQISRNAEEVKAMAMIPPGARVTHFTAGTRKGKVTKEEEKKPGKDHSKEKDCGCS
jgi:hypothetical protein